MLPVLDTQRLRLRAPANADVAALFEIYKDAEAMRYWSRPAMADIAEAESLLGEFQSHAGNEALFQWVIASREDDLAIGTCTLFRIETTHRRAELGYIVRRDHWGRGLASEALTAIVNFAFGTLGLHRIEADIDPRNIRSVRAVTRLGFHFEGRLRERFFVAGEIQDSAIYGLLERDWRAR